MMVSTVSEDLQEVTSKQKEGYKSQSEHVTHWYSSSAIGSQHEICLAALRNDFTPGCCCLALC